MTKNFAQRAAQHGDRFKTITKEYINIGSRGAAKGFEQMKIDAAGGVKNLENAIDEASGIGSVMLNRLKHKNANLDDDFVSKIGTKSSFKTIGSDAYNEIMKLSDGDLLYILKNPTTLKAKYADRIMGALGPIVNNKDYSNGAYFWDATYLKDTARPGFVWNQYTKGTFEITSALGGTTFFKYTNGNRWP